MGFTDQFKRGKTKTTHTSINFSFLVLAIYGLIGVGEIYLGYKLILIGTTNGFNFTSDLKGWKLGLASTSPGLFLVFCGSVISLYALRLLARLDSTEPLHTKRRLSPDHPIAQLIREAKQQENEGGENPKG